MKKIYKYILVLIVLLILVCLILLITKKTDKQNHNSPVIDNSECIQKGKVCSSDEIFNGVKIKYDVNDSDSYNFYVINNDEDNMTLLMDTNFRNYVNWYDEIGNFKGPIKVMHMFMLYTDDWTNVPIISNYHYDDYGKKSYIENCNDNSDPNLQCSEGEEQYYGYEYLNFDANGKGIIMPSGDYSKWEFENSMRVRAISVEEYLALKADGQMPKWLIDNLKPNEGYWTLSSSVTMKTNYYMGAYAVVNFDDKPSIETAYVMGDYEKNFEIGIRPVITVPKR